MISPARELFSLLHDVARLSRVEADRRARIHGMTLAQWKLLAQLQRTPGMTQKEAADMLEVEPITVARLVDRLEAAELLERRPDAEDRRVWRLHLREAAAAALGRMETQSNELAGQMVAGVDGDLRAAMIAALLCMKKNLARGAPALVAPALVAPAPLPPLPEPV